VSIPEEDFPEKRISTLTEQLDAAKALLELACADIIIFHSQEYGPFINPETPEPQVTVAFSVMVNDVFYPAADADGFEITDAIPLRDVYRKDGYEGVVRWVQKRRDNLPLRPHVEKRVKAREDLRAENDRLRAALDKATGPVTDEEWPKTWEGHPRPSITRSAVNSLIASRAAGAERNNGVADESPTI
jgi:hypothetical protein